MSVLRIRIERDGAGEFSRSDDHVRLGDLEVAKVLFARVAEVMGPREGAIGLEPGEKCAVGAYGRKERAVEIHCAGHSFKTGTGTFDLEVPAGSLQSVPDAGAAAGLDLSSGLGVRAQIQVVGIFTPSSKIRVAVLFVDPEQFVKGKSMPFDWQRAFGVAVEVPDGVNTEQIGLFNHGTLTLDEANMTPGGIVSGSFSADLISL